MAQHRGRRGFRLEDDSRVIGTCLADEFTKLCSFLRRKAICVIDHHIGACGLQSLQKGAETTDEGGQEVTIREG
jgi:hypothetical protein